MKFIHGTKKRFSIVTHTLSRNCLAADCVLLRSCIVRKTMKIEDDFYLFRLWSEWDQSEQTESIWNIYIYENEREQGVGMS